MKARLITAISLGLAAAAMAVMPAAVKAQEAPTDYNYVGIGVGAGGLGGSNVGLSINSKFTVADQVSVRPGAVSNLNFSNSGQTLVMLPVTYDFNPITNNGRILPYAGAGLALETQGSTSVGPMATAGVDYRITDNFTANGAVNLTVAGDTRVTGTVGIGYNF
ncbi:MAG TPA: hypothetical protein V6D07_16980 [Trichocoleus sp.]